VRARPDGVEERQLGLALAEGWRIDAAARERSRVIVDNFVDIF
jgi:hypothetical protein